MMKPVYNNAPIVISATNPNRAVWSKPNRSVNENIPIMYLAQMFEEAIQPPQKTSQNNGEMKSEILFYDSKNREARLKLWKIASERIIKQKANPKTNPESGKLAR